MFDSANSLCSARTRRRYRSRIDPLSKPHITKTFKVEFSVNGVKQDYAMKLGEGGEAFFVFETTDEIPASLQTSPLVSPSSSPKMRSEENLPPSLQEPDYLDLDRSSTGNLDGKSSTALPVLSRSMRASSDLGGFYCRLPYIMLYHVIDIICDRYPYSSFTVAG